MFKREKISLAINLNLLKGAETMDEKGKAYLPPDEPVNENPESCAELLHKYGTYEIQPTAATENEFPQITQGKAKKQKKR